MSRTLPEKVAVANKCSRPSFRYCQSTVTDDRQVALSRAIGLSAANGQEGGSEWTIQRSVSAVGRMDVHGLDVRRLVAMGWQMIDNQQYARFPQRIPSRPQRQLLQSSNIVSRRARQTSSARPRCCRNARRLDSVFHRCTCRARQGTLANSVRGQQVAATVQRAH